MEGDAQARRVALAIGQNDLKDKVQMRLRAHMPNWRTLKRYPDALIPLRASVLRAPNLRGTHNILAATYAQLGDSKWPAWR
jgi:hypothetical protein